MHKVSKYVKPVYMSGQCECVALFSHMIIILCASVYVLCMCCLYALHTCVYATIGYYGTFGGIPSLVQLFQAN